MTEAASSSRGTLSPITLLMFAIALGGLLYAGLGFIGLQEAQIPSGWTQVQGQVLSSRVAEDAESKLFTPQVRYRFEADGKFYIGEKLSRHHPGRTLQGVAETEIEDLPQGTNVQVHFDPADPEQAVLRKDDTIGAMQAISAGLAIGLTSLGIGIVSLRRRRKPTEN